MYIIIKGEGKQEETWMLYGCTIERKDTQYFKNNCVSRQNDYRGCGSCYIRKVCNSNAKRLMTTAISNFFKNGHSWEHHHSGKSLLLNEIEE